MNSVDFRLLNVESPNDRRVLRIKPWAMKRTRVEHAMRQAMLRGWSHAWAQRAYDRPQDAERAMWALKKDRDRLWSDLYEAGYSFRKEQGTTKEQLAQFQYCPVAGAQMRKPKKGDPNEMENTTANYCRMPLLCPFCWARDIVKPAWNAFVAASKVERYSKWSLHVARRVERIAIPTSARQGDITQLVQDAHAGVPVGPLRPVRRYSKGGINRTSLELEVDCLKITHRSIFLIPNNSKGPVEKPGVEITNYPTFSTSTTTKAIVESLYWPGMVALRAPADTIRLLRAIQRSSQMKWGGNFGILYGKSLDNLLRPEAEDETPCLSLDAD